MAEILNDLEAPSDAELISRVRGGDSDAYGELFSRHVASARRLARQLVRGSDSEDLVSEAFTKVMGALQGGGGPDIAFRAYLLTAVRRLHVDRIRIQSRLTTSDDLSEFDPGVPFQDTVVEQFESGAAARAFATLPERWQMVLWHLEVERQKPAEIAPLLGMTANSVSALAYRAREGLRQAFLSAHLADIDEADCRWVVEQLGGYVRKGLSRRDAGKVKGHLDECRACYGRYLELEEVNSDLSGVIAPLLLGGLATGYLGATGSGITIGGGVVALLDRAKDYAVAHVAPVAAGTTAAGVAAAVVIVGGVGSGGRMSEPDGAAAPPSRVSDAQAVDSPPERGRARPAGTGSGEQGSGKPGPGTGTRPTDDKAAPAEPAPSEAGAPTPAAPTSAPQSQPSAGTSADDITEGEPSDQGEQDEQGGQLPEPSESAEPETRDISLTLAGNTLSKGIGRFRTHVTNLPTASGPTPVQLRITFSDSDVHLERIPPDCTWAGTSGVTCSAEGAAHNGQFDADMGALAPGETVTITVTATVAAPADPDPSDNTRSLTLARTGAGRILAKN